jgi:hypothetical protein
MRSHAKARVGCAGRRHEDLDSNAQILGGDDKTSYLCENKNALWKWAISHKIFHAKSAYGH